jgi:FkbM family methyltransferase
MFDWDILACTDPRLDGIDVARYEDNFIRSLADRLTQLPAPITLIDGGADFGLFSLKLCSICPSIQRILAFEPNSDGYSYLKFNLDRLPFLAEAIPRALADFQGNGILEIPSSDIDIDLRILDYAAQYLKRSPEGNISVTTIDSLAISPSESLILKLDIEGGELAALRGAARTVQTASNIVLTLEAHPLVTRRTGVDPIEYLRLLASWRTFTFVAAESGMSLDTKRPVFDQHPREIHNIIAISESPA